MTYLSKPLIGITADHIDPSYEQGREYYSDIPWYALRDQYCIAVSQAGGVPFIIPYDKDAIESYTQTFDGVIFTGGGFDVDPTLYGIDIRHPTVNIRPQRTKFEFELMKGILEANKPVLGICAGMQLMNVFHGGSLFQHLPEEAPSDINHLQTQSRFEAQHTITIQKDTYLDRFINNNAEGKVVHVNSIHHQGIRRLAPGFVINAIAEDNMIEGIESSQYRFCLGTQWHPEFYVTDIDRSIFKEFIKACGTK